jgi:hypothetical protein
MATTPPTDSRPPWDSALALSLVAKRVLIGINYCDNNDNLIEQKQVYGTIIKADATDGFAIRLEGQKEGELFWLPPDIRAFQDAEPGEYRLRSTGEIIVDPDFIMYWTVNRPPPHDQNRSPDGLPREEK